MDSCNWCGKRLEEGEARRVPSPVRWLAAGGMAFVHGGLWAMEWLAKPFCARCRTILIPAVLAAAASVLAVVGFLARLWLRS